MTIGPDRPITLHLADARFQEVFTNAVVQENMDRKFKANIQVLNASTDMICYCALIDPQSGETIKEGEFVGKLESADLDWDLDSARVDLWWPNGQGEQKRYRFDCQLKSEVCICYRFLTFLLNTDRFPRDHRQVSFWTPFPG